MPEKLKEFEHCMQMYKKRRIVSKDEKKKLKINCQICKKGFSNRSTLAMHNSSCHSNEKNKQKGEMYKKCTFPSCDGTYKVGKGMSEHMTKVHGIRDLNCEKCGKQFSRRFTRIRHEETCKGKNKKK